MILAAIDIGSNAIRLQLTRVYSVNDQVSFKRMEYIRFPLRLGSDAFQLGRIREETKVKFDKLMQTFKLLIELYETDAYLATATSAMRDAENGQLIVKHLAKSYDLHVRIISGRKEAEYLSKAILPYLDDQNYVHIDVGGGSTELTIYQQHKIVSSSSFQLGTVRQLDKSQRREILDEISGWLGKNLEALGMPIVTVGTGGNINKLFKLSSQTQGSSISLTELHALRAYVNAYSIEERINILKMNPDRADVIVPAADIFIDLMGMIGADHVMVPGVGLKEGLLYALYEHQTGESIRDIQFLGTF